MLEVIITISLLKTLHITLWNALKARTHVCLKIKFDMAIVEYSKHHNMDIEY